MYKLTMYALICECGETDTFLHVVCYIPPRPGLAEPHAEERPRRQRPLLPAPPLVGEGDIIVEHVILNHMYMYVCIYIYIYTHLFIL